MAIDPKTGERIPGGPSQIDPKTGERIVQQVAGAGPLGLPQPKNPAVQMQAPALGSAPQIASDVAVGALKGAGRTASNIGKMIVPDAVFGGNVGQPKILQPTNTAQKIGGIGEQAAEFLLPGPAEEAAMAKLAPYVGKAAPLLKAGLAAVGSGAVNKAQGGSFTTGAVAGGVGSGIGQGMARLAPSVAESALNIRRLDRAYKPSGAIGRGILDETKGFSPSTVADSAQSKLNVLNPALNAAADAASTHSPAETLLNRAIGTPNPTERNVASLAGARGVLSNAVDTATKQGERTTFSQLQPMSAHLGESMFGLPIPENVTPRQLLDLKRGFGNEFIHRWNPETMTGVKGTAGQAYHALADEFNNAVPGARDLNNKISTMIPIAKRAESLELNAPTAQKIAQRIAAPTGALVGPLIGGAEGYEHGGMKGGLEGAALGLLGPALFTTPTGQMILARVMNSGAVSPGLKLLTGAGLQMSSRNKNTTTKAPQ